MHRVETKRRGSYYYGNNSVWYVYYSGVYKFVERKTFVFRGKILIVEELRRHSLLSDGLRLKHLSGFGL